MLFCLVYINQKSRTEVNLLHHFCPCATIGTEVDFEIACGQFQYRKVQMFKNSRTVYSMCAETIRVTVSFGMRCMDAEQEVIPYALLASRAE